MSKMMLLVLNMETRELLCGAQHLLTAPCLCFTASKLKCAIFKSTDDTNLGVFWCDVQVQIQSSPWLSFAHAHVLAGPTARMLLCGKMQEELS